MTTSPDSPQQLAEEIERTRTQLGETVEALAAKADLKSRAQVKANQLAVQVKGKANQATVQVRQDPVPVAVSAGATVVAVIAALLLVRWRRQ